MMKSGEFKRVVLPRITTGSANFDRLLGGGLPRAAITDVYGHAGSGKTQFSFQIAMTACEEELMTKVAPSIPTVVFIDCSGSFRPERIAEMLAARGIEANRILDRISTISVRSVAEQRNASNRVERDSVFSGCKLLIVDDVTVNFIGDYVKEKEMAARQWNLSIYVRHLSYIANTRGISVLLTNSVRARGDAGEGETTGDVISSLALFRLRFTRVDRTRLAILEQPARKYNVVEFVIDDSGLH